MSASAVSVLRVQDATEAPVAMCRPESPQVRDLGLAGRGSSGLPGAARAIAAIVTTVVGRPSCVGLRSHCGMTVGSLSHHCRQWRPERSVKPASRATFSNHRRLFHGGQLVLVLLRESLPQYDASWRSSSSPAAASAATSSAETTSTPPPSSGARKKVMSAATPARWHGMLRRQHACGMPHNAALRHLAGRFVGVLHGCLASRTTYDESTAWAHHLAVA
jgi:hypothetical protein